MAYNKPAEKKKSHPIQFFVTPAEYQEIVGRADELNISISEMFRLAYKSVYHNPSGTGTRETASGNRHAQNAA